MNKTTNTLEDSCTGDGQAATYTVRNLPGFFIHGGAKMKKAERIKSNLNFKKERTAHKKKVVGMNFDDFKKEYLESIDTLEEMILETTSWGTGQRNMIVEAFTKGRKRIDKDLVMLAKNFKVLDDRLHALEGFTAIMAIKIKEAMQRKPMTFEERKAVAGLVSIKWDKADDKTFNEAA